MKVLLTVVGWLLTLAGVAALVLPGPGLMLLFAGVAVLAQVYPWAERWLDPIELRALRSAAAGVETTSRVVMSTLGAVGLGAVGGLWIVQPAAPSWWPIADKWWLFGGPWTGWTLVFSAVVALALLVYSYRRFHGNPDAVAALGREIEDADGERRASADRVRQRLHREGQ